MSDRIDWANRFALDIDFGYVGGAADGPRHYNPRLVMNGAGSTVEHALVEELSTMLGVHLLGCFHLGGRDSPAKQHLLDFRGAGSIVTSDFLGFNEPRAFAEL